MYGDLKILTGTANPQLAMDICDHLGCALTPALCETFSDGELRVEIGASVRGHDVFVIQPTCAPTNRNLMQLCLMLDALKRASAGRITAVIPYYGYARQDRKVSPRAPISAKMVADFLSMAGAQRIVTVDLHAGQIQGFFNCPVDNLFASPVLLQYVRHLRGDLVMVSPDAGGVERTRAFAKKMDAGLAIIDKRRDRPNQATAMNVVGDVAGKVAVLAASMLLGTAATGLFLYVMISIIYGLWKRVGSCLIGLIVPLALFGAPLVFMIAPRQGAVTIGLAVAFLIAVLFDVVNVRNLARLYRVAKRAAS